MARVGRYVSTDIGRNICVEFLIDSRLSRAWELSNIWFVIQMSRIQDIFVRRQTRSSGFENALLPYSIPTLSTKLVRSLESLFLTRRVTWSPSFQRKLHVWPLQGLVWQHDRNAVIGWGRIRGRKVFITACIKSSRANTTENLKLRLINTGVSQKPTVFIRNRK